MQIKALSRLITFSLFFLSPLTCNADVLALESRLGGLAYYDPNLNITWAADTALTRIDTWDNQQNWVSNLTIAGVDGWRLPSMDVNGDGNVINCTGGGISDCTDNELGFLYWDEGITTGTPGPFSNVINDAYWSSTEYDINNAWVFSFSNGNQIGFGGIKRVNLYAWAVHSGDVSAVPVPSAMWLFGTGLIVLVGALKKNT